jgi:hypothetical protein
MQNIACLSLTACSFDHSLRLRLSRRRQGLCSYMLGLLGFLQCLGYTLLLFLQHLHFGRSLRLHLSRSRSASPTTLDNFLAAVSVSICRAVGSASAAVWFSPLLVAPPPTPCSSARPLPAPILAMDSCPFVSANDGDNNAWCFQDDTCLFDSCNDLDSDCLGADNTVCKNDPNPDVDSQNCVVTWTLAANDLNSDGLRQLDLGS